MEHIHVKRRYKSSALKFDRYEAADGESADMDATVSL
jgi:hypothetical protein